RQRRKCCSTCTPSTKLARLEDRREFPAKRGWNAMSASPRMPASWRGRVRVPAIAAPMFLASNPALAKACCRAGIIGCFPALNQRSPAGLAHWLDEMAEQLTERDAPFGVNLIVHKSNPRMEADLVEVVKHQVPLVITSLGAANELVDAIHGY